MNAKCFICGFTRKDKYKVIHHLKKVHLEDEFDKNSIKLILESIENIKKNIDPQVCQICYKSFVSEKGLKSHVRSGYCYEKLNVGSFEPNKIGLNIEQYADDLSELNKIVTICREAMAKISKKDKIFTIDEPEEEYRLRNFYQEDISHCPKYIEFYVKYIKKINGADSCHTVLTRFFEIIYLNRDYPWNHNIVVNDNEFGSLFKLYVGNEWHFVKSQPFFEQSLLTHLSDIVLLISKKLVQIMSDNRIFGREDYIRIKSSLSSFLENQTLRSRLGIHLYYLSYIYNNPENIREISIDELSIFQKK